VSGMMPSARVARGSSRVRQVLFGSYFMVPVK